VHCLTRRSRKKRAAFAAQAVLLHRLSLNSLGGLDPGCLELPDASEHENCIPFRRIVNASHPEIFCKDSKSTSIFFLCNATDISVNLYEPVFLSLYNVYCLSFVFTDCSILPVSCERLAKYQWYILGYMGTKDC